MPSPSAPLIMPREGNAADAAGGAALSRTLSMDRKVLGNARKRSGQALTPRPPLPTLGEGEKGAPEVRLSALRRFRPTRRRDRRRGISPIRSGAIPMRADFYPSAARRTTPGDLTVISWLREVFP